MGGRGGGGSAAKSGKGRDRNAAAGGNLPTGITAGHIDSQSLAVLQKALGGANLTQIAAAVGALDGAIVDIEKMRGEQITVNIRHPYISLQERIFSIKDGKIAYIKNDMFFKRDSAPSGVGVTSFARQVDWAKRLGVPKIKVYAARSETMNGYYTWARFGYNAKLKDGRTLHEVMRTAAGRKWWKAKGYSFNGEFSLKTGSASLKVFNAYIKERGK